MKLFRTVLIAFSLLMANSHLFADNLLPYVETRVVPNDIITFSSEGISFRTCISCPVKSIRAAVGTTYWKQNNIITFKEATELYVGKSYDYIAVFYNRTDSVFDRIIFDGTDELAIIPLSTSGERIGGEK